MALENLLGLQGGTIPFPQVPEIILPPGIDEAVKESRTSEEAAEEILRKGIKPVERRKVHLSASIEEATEVGKRRTSEPVILEIDIERATKEGIRIEKASEKVYVADYIPPKSIKCIEGDIHEFYIGWQM